MTPLPDNLSFAEGATLGIPGMTAWCCLFADGPIAGKTVLVTGGAGAVGHYAVQLAKWGGAQVIATVSSAMKARAGAAGGRRSRDQLQDRGRRRQGDGVYRRRGVDRVVDVDFGGNIATTLKLMAHEFDHRGLRHQRQPHACRADARTDGEMHHAARAGAVRAAAAAARGGAGRHHQMAGRRARAFTTSRRSLRCRTRRRRISRSRRATSSAP